MDALLTRTIRIGYRAQLCAQRAPVRSVTSLLSVTYLIPLLMAFLVGRAPCSAAQEKVAPAQDFNLVLTGDSVIETPATIHQGEPTFMGLVNDLRQADAAFTNLEETYPARGTYPAATSGGTWMTADPSVVKELQWMGFNLFAAATVHSFDFGMQGILDSITTLRDDNAAYAGIGETLGEARAPGYFSTPHGRIALIACTSAFLSSAPAGDPRPDMLGHPGVSPLHFQTIYDVDAPTFESVRKLKEALQLGGGPNAANAQTLTLPSGSSFNGYTSAVFHLSDKTGVETKADPADSAAIYGSIQEGRKMADYVVADINAFEGMPGPEGSSEPAQYLKDFAHGAIDAGADVVAGTGFHELRGIEIYKGRVIFYSLGDLWIQDNIIHAQPSEFYRPYHLGPDAQPSQAYDARGWDGPRINLLWYQTVLAKVVFHEGRPAQVILTPVSITTAPRADAGVPYLADPEAANEILTRLQELSQPFGTNITIHDGIGIITMSQRY